MKGTSATGVEFSRGGRTLQAFAGSEVIVSAERVQFTANFNLLSGIGPSGHFKVPWAFRRWSICRVGQNTA